MTPTDTHYALLVVDMQRAYFNNDALAVRQQQLVSACNKLIAAAVEQDVPVWCVRTLHQPDGATWTRNMKQDREGYLLIGEVDAEYVDGLHLEGAMHLSKTRDSAFMQTPLASMLRGVGITDVILAGISTHTCILQTAADAYAEGFGVTLVREAIASHDETMQEPALTILTQEYRQQVWPLATTLRALRGS